MTSVGRDRGFTEEQVADTLHNLKDSLSRLETRLSGREYLAGEYSLADIAHAGVFGRLRDLDGRGEVPLADYPAVAAWMERIEARESYEAAG